MIATALTTAAPGLIVDESASLACNPPEDEANSDEGRDGVVVYRAPGLDLSTRFRVSA